MIQERIESPITRELQWRRLMPLLAYSRKFMLFKTLAEMKKFIAFLARAIAAEYKAMKDMLNEQRNMVRLQGISDRNSADYLILLAKDQLQRISNRLGSCHAKVGDAMWKLAELHMAKNQNYLAIPLLKKAMSIFAANFGENDLGIAGCQIDLANALQDQGKFEEAIAASQASASIYSQYPGETDRALAAALTTLGYSYIELGQLSECEKVTRRYLDIYLRLHGEGHPDTILALQNLGVVLAQAGRSGQAEKLLKRAVAAAEKALCPFDCTTEHCVRSLVDFYQNTGRQKEAEALMESIDAAQSELLAG